MILPSSSWSRQTLQVINTFPTQTIKFIKKRCRWGIIVPGKLEISECQVMSSREGDSLIPSPINVKSNVKRKKLNNLICGKPSNRDLNSVQVSRVSELLLYTLLKTSVSKQHSFRSMVRVSSLPRISYFVNLAFKVLSSRDRNARKPPTFVGFVRL